MEGKNRITVGDVTEVYQSKLLGPWGQNDLIYYETRLKEGLGGDDIYYPIAMEILAEAAIKEVFTLDARNCLEQMYSTLVDDMPACIAEVLEVLEHDGYLENSKSGYRFPSRLLRDWWSIRFRHHIPIENRRPADKSQEQTR